MDTVHYVWNEKYNVNIKEKKGIFKGSTPPPLSGHFCKASLFKCPLPYLVEVKFTPGELSIALVLASTEPPCIRPPLDASFLNWSKMSF